MEHPIDSITSGSRDWPSAGGHRRSGHEIRACRSLTKVYRPRRSHSRCGSKAGIVPPSGNEERGTAGMHMFDTVKAGLSRRSGRHRDHDPGRPRTLIELEHNGGAVNRTPDGKIARGAFGGHTRAFGKAPIKRACYAADRTGRVILDTLWEKCLQLGIQFFHEFSAHGLNRRPGPMPGSHRL